MQEENGGGSQSKQFLQSKELIEKMFKTVSESSLKEIKAYFNNISSQISSTNQSNNTKKSKGLPSSAISIQDFQSLSEMINTCKEGKNKTVLHFAASRGDFSIFKYLLELGADANLKDDEDNTALFVSAQHGNLEIVKFLLEERKMDVNAKRKGDATLLHLAASNGDIKLLEYLLSQGAKINAKSEFGTPLLWAIGETRKNAAKFLLEKGADPNGSSIDLKPEIKAKVGEKEQKEKEEGKKQSEEAGGQEQQQQENQQKQQQHQQQEQDSSDNNINISSQLPCPLILAADQNQLDVFEMLLEYKADVNCKDPAGWSVLHLCAEKGNKRMVEILLGKGVDPNYENEGKTPLLQAMLYNKTEIVQILKPVTKKSFALSEEQFKSLQQQKLNAEQQQQSLQNQSQIKENLSEEQLKLIKEQALQLKNEGNAFFNENKLDEALAKYVESCKCDPTQVAVYTNIAASLIKLKRFKEALEYCQKARVIDPKWVKTYFREGEAYSGLNLHGDAAASFWEAFQLDPASKIFKKLFEDSIKIGKELAAKNLKQ